MFNVRFIVHLENKEKITTDWDEDISEEELVNYDKACRNIKQLKCFVTHVDGKETYIHPDKVTHVQLDISGREEELGEDQDQEQSTVEVDMLKNKKKAGTKKKSSTPSKEQPSEDEQG